jgi:hypothetical protein
VLLALAISGVIVLTTLALMVVGHARPSKMKTHLNALSPGRILATSLHPNECDQQISATIRLQTFGSKNITISKHNIPTARIRWLIRTGRVATGRRDYDYKYDAPSTDENGNFNYDEIYSTKF